MTIFGHRAVGVVALALVMVVAACGGDGPAPPEALQPARQRPCHRRAFAAKTLAIHSIDVAVGARKLGVIRADVAVALSLAHHKAVGFDRRFPEVDFDALKPAGRRVLPVGAAGGARQDGMRNRPQPRQPVRPEG